MGMVTIASGTRSLVQDKTMAENNGGLVLLQRGRAWCKSWTLDSGLDSWTGLWTEIWTGFRIENGIE